jgi:hypothetical protein
LAFTLLGFGALAVLAAPPAGQDNKTASGTPQKVAIPFDFESKFDDGRYGQIIGDLVWKRLQRQGGFIIPEAMQETRDWCERNKFLPGPDTPLDKMKAIVTREQAGHVAIWGKVERVAGNETDVYDLWIYVADFSTDPVKMIYEKKARTNTVSEIPHVYVKEALDRLYERPPPPPVAVDPAIGERWARGSNLVKGDFEKGTRGPMGWDPVGKGVSWVADPGSKGRNHLIRFTMNEEVAGTTGVLYYSEFFPVQEGALYRFQCRWKTTGSAAKVFIKCYDEMPTQFQNSAGGSRGSEKREVYRSQQNLQGKVGSWNIHTEDFTPTHTHYTPRWGRVMLYAYWPAGTVEWDDVLVKQIAPAPPRKDKDKRPSLETKVKSKDIGK